MVFISWVPFHRRSADVARLLGADPVFVARGRHRRRLTAPFRHLWQAAITARLLRRQRPAVVFVMTPPQLLPVVARLAIGRKTPMVVDAHGKGVRRIGSSRVRLSFRLVGRLADAVMVTNRHEAERVRPFCRQVHEIHDPIDKPWAHEPRKDQAASGRPVIVFPASWERDEPIDEIVATARSLPQFDWVITGRPRRVLDAPENLRCSGRLTDPDYVDLVASCAVVLALTTRDDTMQRAGYDAVVAGVPLVASDTAALREFFGPAAEYCDATSASIAEAVTRAVERSQELRLALRELGDGYRAAQGAAIETLVASLPTPTNRRR